MKKKLLTATVAILMATAFSVPALAQGAMTTVKGTAIDRSGQPITDAEVHLDSAETGRHYVLKTNKKGEIFSIAVTTGIYKITLMKNGQVLYNIGRFPITLAGNTANGETVIPLDLQKEAQAQGQAAPGQAAPGQGQQQVSPEEQAQREAKEKQTTNIKNLNAMLSQAKTAEDAGNYDQAISILNQATQVDPTQNVPWARLGQVHLDAAAKETDRAQRKEQYAAAIDPLKKAVSILSSAPKPDTVELAKYYNNLGKAQAMSGDTDSAIENYNKAATTDPTNAGTYYFNLGATLTNANKTDDAIAAYDKAIAADPNRADAYYYKGIAMLGKAKLKGDKMEAPEGTAEAFNKYLELQPDGPLAEQAKQMLTAIGAKVETSFGKKKPKK